MKRVVADLAIVLLTSAYIALLASLGCHQKLREDVRVDTASSFDLDAGLHIDDQVQQHVALEEHQIVTTGPVEQIAEKLGPDGGVTDRVVTRWGGGVVDAWQKQAMGSDEHVHVDAQLEVKAAGEGHAASKIEKETDAGGFGLGLKIGAMLVLLLLAAAGYAAYRLNKLRKAALP